MARRRSCSIFLTLLALFLVGTVIVLSTVSFYLSIDPSAFITEAEVAAVISHSEDPVPIPERIPRILHQTWKSEVLPEKWQNISQHCRDLMPDYEYMLWTDASSRDFIASNYSWFLPTFDAYKYPIQRADAIRYFVLHHYGGVYLDLDVGCLKRLDPLLVFPVILPKTIPVGVSNDLMFAEKGHPFMEQTIHNLITFDHDYILNYPTVMFSTGPMFVSAQYGLYAASHPAGDVRILPKILYGKNAKTGEAPHSYFEHYYGSSWHADDAGFITFLGRWGKGLMWLGLAILVVGILRIFLLRKSHGSSSEGWRRRIPLVGYEIQLPRSLTRAGYVFLAPAHAPDQSSPSSSEPSSPSTPRIPVLPVAFEVRPPSPATSSSSSSIAEPSTNLLSNSWSNAFRRAGTWVRSSISADSSPSRSRGRSARRSRGVLYFLPAFFAAPVPSAIELSDDIEGPLLPPRRSSPLPQTRRSVVGSDKGSRSRRSSSEYTSATDLPPYEPPQPKPAEWSGQWEEWTEGSSRS